MMYPYRPRPVIPGKKVDFLARREHFIDHMLGIWNNIPEELRGSFYIPKHLGPYAEKKGLGGDKLVLKQTRTLNGVDLTLPPSEGRTLVTCAYGDMMVGYKDGQRPLVLMEHGVGLIFLSDPSRGIYHPGYAGGAGGRAQASMFLAPNDFIAAKTKKTFPKARQVVIGTPKLDEFENYKPKPPGKKPLVVISFHWDGGKQVAPEAGTAFWYYKDELPALAERFNLAIHAHPKIRKEVFSHARMQHIPVIENFRDVMLEAWMYVNDCSSTGYEFAVTGKPVVLLNAPHFRRNIEHGIRFWAYTKWCPMVDNKIHLSTIIAKALPDRIPFLVAARKKMVRELYPNIGTSAKVAADAIIKLITGEK